MGADSGDSEFPGQLGLRQFGVTSENVGIKQRLPDDVRLVVEFLLPSGNSQRIAELALRDGPTVFEPRRMLAEVDPLVSSLQLHVVGQREAPKPGPAAFRRCRSVPRLNSSLT